MASQRGKTLLKGHSLVNEGQAYDEKGRAVYSGDWAGTGGSGRAKCSCGWLSDWLQSSRERKQAHREHKDALRNV